MEQGQLPAVIYSSCSPTGMGTRQSNMEMFGPAPGSGTRRVFCAGGEERSEHSRAAGPDMY